MQCGKQRPVGKALGARTCVKAPGDAGKVEGEAELSQDPRQPWRGQGMP